MTFEVKKAFEVEEGHIEPNMIFEEIENYIFRQNSIITQKKVV